MIFYKKLKGLLLPAFLLFLLFAATILFLNTLIQKKSVQTYLLEEISSISGYELYSGRIELALWGGLGLSVHNLSVVSPEGSEKITAFRLNMKFDVGELLKGRFIPREIRLIAPEIALSNPGSSGHLEMQGEPFPGESILKKFAALSSVVLEDAHVCVQGFPFELENLFARITPGDKAPDTISASLRGTTVFGGEEIPFTSEIGLLLKTGTDMSLRMVLKSGDVPLSLFSWPGVVPVKGGTGKMMITVQGNPGESMTAEGRIHFKKPDFLIVDDDDRKRFVFDELHLPFSASYSEGNILIPSFELQGPGFLLKGNAALNFENLTNPHLALEVGSNGMALEKFKRIFPSSLLPTWLESELFPLFSGGTIMVAPFSLHGTMEQIANLDHVKNAGALLLRLDCRKLTAFKESEGLPVKDVFGTLEIEKGSIKVSGVKAHFRDSSISKGTLHVDSLYVDDPKYLVTTVGSFDIADLLEQKRLHLLPDYVPRNLKDFETVSGRMDTEFTLSYEDDWEFPEIKQGRFVFSNCRLKHKKIVFPAMVKDGLLTVESDGRKKFSASGWWGRSSMETSGTIGKTWDTGQAQILSEMDMNEFLERFFPETSPAMHFKTPVPCGVSLTKGKEEWTLDGNIDLKKVFLETDTLVVAPFKIQGETIFHATLKPGKEFRISHLKCDMGGSKFRFEGLVDMENDNAIQFDVFSNRIVLEDLGIRFKKRNLLAGGSLGFDASVKISPSKPMETTVHGRMTGTGLSFETSAFPLPVRNCSLNVGFSGKKIRIDTLRLNMGKTDFQVKGNLQGWEGLRGDLAVQTDYLYLSNLLPGGLPAIVNKFSSQRGKADLAAKPEGAAQDRVFEPILKISSKTPDTPFLQEERRQIASLRKPTKSVLDSSRKSDEKNKKWKKNAGKFLKKSDIHLNIKALRGELEQFSYGPIKIECALRAGDAYVSRSRFDWKNGSIRLRGHMKKNETPETVVSGHLEMNRQPLRELPKSFDFIKSNMEGEMSMEALFFLEGNSGKELVSNLTGSVNFDLEHGVLKKSHVFIKVMDFLSLQRIFQERPSNLSSEGLYFESIGGNVGLEKGIARTDGLTMQSPVFNALVSGEANLNTLILNAELGILPLVSIDTVISSIPIVGYLLTGEEKALYADYFEVKGPISDPEVNYIALKSISNGAFGLLKRIFLTPQRLFKNISDAAEEFEEEKGPLPGDEFRPENDMGA